MNNLNHLVLLLLAWEQELKTNQNGMQYLAERAIKVIEKEIEMCNRI